MKNGLRKQLKSNRSSIQFLKFGIVGLSNNLIWYAIYLVFVLLGIHYILSNILGYIISILNAYYWNRSFVFKEKDETVVKATTSFIKMILSYIFTGLILNNLILVVLIQKVNMSKLIAPIFTLLITVPVNFILNKFWVFSHQG